MKFIERLSQEEKTMSKKDSSTLGFEKDSNTESEVTENAAVPEVPAPEGTPPPEQNGGNEDKPKPDPRMGLVRFLQVFPQKPGITALLSSKHIGDVKTKQEWEVVIQHLLHKKVW
jgi:hypothetical protein